MKQPLPPLCAVDKDMVSRVAASLLVGGIAGDAIFGAGAWMARPLVAVNASSPKGASGTRFSARAWMALLVAVKAMPSVLGAAGPSIFGAGALTARPLVAVKATFAWRRRRTAVAREDGQPWARSSC